MIIIYDGNCNLCLKAKSFIEKRNSKINFIKSKNKKLNTLIVIENDDYFIKSEAIFKIIPKLDKIYKIFYIFKLFPRKTNDKLYDFIAKKRYKFFGKCEC